MIGLASRYIKINVKIQNIHIVVFMTRLSLYVVNITNKV